jgi:hypothetical protein
VLQRALDRLNTAQRPEQFAAGLQRAKALTSKAHATARNEAPTRRYQRGVL